MLHKVYILNEIQGKDKLRLRAVILLLLITFVNNRIYIIHCSVPSAQLN